MTTIKDLGCAKIQLTEPRRWHLLGFTVPGYAPGSRPEEKMPDRLIDERSTPAVMET